MSSASTAVTTVVMDPAAPPSNPSLDPMILAVYDTVSDPILIVSIINQSPSKQPSSSQVASTPTVSILFGNLAACGLFCVANTLQLQSVPLSRLMPKLDVHTLLSGQDCTQQQQQQSQQPQIKVRPLVGPKVKVHMSSTQLPHFPKNPAPNATSSSSSSSRTDHRNTDILVLTLKRVPSQKMSVPSRYKTEFEELELLGKGGYGIVHRARNLLDGQDYAIKKVKLTCTPEDFHSLAYAVTSSSATDSPQPPITALFTIRPASVPPTPGQRRLRNAVSLASVKSLDATLTPGRRGRRMSQTDTRMVTEVKVFARLASHPNIVGYHTTWIEGVEQDSSDDSDVEDGDEVPESNQTQQRDNHMLGSEPQDDSVSSATQTTATDTSLNSDTTSSEPGNGSGMFRCPSENSIDSSRASSFSARSPDKEADDLLTPSACAIFTRKPFSTTLTTLSSSSPATSSVQSLGKPTTWTLPNHFEFDFELDQPPSSANPKSKPSFKRSSLIGISSSTASTTSPTTSSSSTTSTSFPTTSIRSGITLGLQQQQSKLNPATLPSSSTTTSRSQTTNPTNSAASSFSNPAQLSLQIDPPFVRHASPISTMTLKPQQNHKHQPSKRSKKNHRATLFIQMQLCPHMNLRTFIQQQVLTPPETHHPESPGSVSQKCVIDEESRWIRLCIFKQIVDAVMHIHAQGVIHRDLKPENIFVEEDFNVLLGDFGLAKTIVEYALTPSSFGSYDADGFDGVEVDSSIDQGTFLYMAPEILLSHTCTTRSDMYSLGVLLFELFVPFGTSMERIVTLQALRNQRDPQTDSATILNSPDCLRAIPDDIKDLIDRLVRTDPAERPSATEVAVEPCLLELGAAAGIAPAQVMYGWGSYGANGGTFNSPSPLSRGGISVPVSPSVYRFGGIGSAGMSVGMPNGFSTYMRDSRSRAMSQPLVFAGPSSGGSYKGNRYDHNVNSAFFANCTSRPEEMYQPYPQHRYSDEQQQAQMISLGALATQSSFIRKTDGHGHAPNGPRNGVATNGSWWTSPVWWNKLWDGSHEEAGIGHGTTTAATTATATAAAGTTDPLSVMPASANPDTPIQPPTLQTNSAMSFIHKRMSSLDSAWTAVSSSWMNKPRVSLTEEPSALSGGGAGNGMMMKKETSPSTSTSPSMSSLYSLVSGDTAVVANE